MSNSIATTGKPRLLVVGLGKLGSSMLGVFAKAGFEVRGADLDEEVVNSIGYGKPPPGVSEPGLAELLTNPNIVGAYSDVTEAASLSDVAFIIVPTPSKPSGEFDAAMVVDATERIVKGFARRTRDGYPVIVVVSTVMPGTCDGEITEAINRSAEGTGLPYDSIGLVYSPEYIALGSVIKDLQNPSVVVIGSNDEYSANVASYIYRRVADSTSQIRLNLVEAEIAKLSLNVYLSMKISYANTIARICEQYNAAPRNVLSAVGMDKRVGKALLTPSTPAGGPCLPRDVEAFSTISDNEAVSSFIWESSEAIIDWVLDCVGTHVNPLQDWENEVAVLGLCYKGNVPIVEASFGMEIYRRLLEDERYVIAHDPIAPEIDYINRSDDQAWLLANSKVVIITCEHYGYASVAPIDGQVFIDMWGITTAGPGITLLPGDAP